MDLHINGANELRSLRHEAGRQADFFSARNQTPLWEFWSKLEAMAHEALVQRSGLILSSVIQKDSNIKACE